MAFEIRGIVEGFYGPFYTFAQRTDMLRFLAGHGLNFYLYGPKNDRPHRARWREGYPADTLARFGETVALARQLDIRFAYALSPASMSYASADDLELVLARFRTFYDLGVRDFCLLFDDIHARLEHEADRRRFGSFAQAHADVANRVLARLLALDRGCHLSLCPSEYHGRPPFGAYLHELGACLRPEIDLFYTGPEVCCPTIAAADVQAFARAAGRSPVLWDNYPVNDLGMQFELHLEPLRGRDPALAGAVRGVVINPMLQPEATKIPLATYAAFCADPWHYDPERAWDAALVEVAGATAAPALRRFAETLGPSCLCPAGTTPLERLTGALLAALEAGERADQQAAAGDLAAYLAEIDEARDLLVTRLDNAALRADLLPWIVTLDHWQRAGSTALAALAALERGEGHESSLRRMQEAMDWAGRPLRSDGQVLRRLAEHVLACAQAAPSRAEPAAHLPLVAALMVGG